FFFFQAEDGIRDFHVTGVQTCALPILSDPHLDQRRYPNQLASQLLILINQPSFLPMALDYEESLQLDHNIFHKRFLPLKPSVRQIGRASCRERVDTSVTSERVTKKGAQ